MATWGFAMDGKINAAACKAQCLDLIDEVAGTGETITVTRRSKAKVQIIAVREKPKTLVGALKGSFENLGDIVGPTTDEASHEDRLERQARLIDGKLDDPPARYAHCAVYGGGLEEIGKKSKPSVRRGPRKK